MTACNPKEQLYIASDYVYVGSFTQGLEGPATDNEGTLFFVNPIRSGTIGQVNRLGKFSLFIEQLPEGSIANGIRFGDDGTMYLADYTGHNILSVDVATQVVKIVAFDSLLNQPNDLAICCNNRLYASDPDWKNGTGNLWKIENGTFERIAENMGTTNGIAISPDEKTLYVNESVQRNVWAFDLDIIGRISNKRLLISFEEFGLDGMRCDAKGNLYITRYGKGTVVKVSPKGEVLEEIQLKGKKPSNIAFGGDDGRTVFVTLQDRGYIETFRVSDAGKNFQ
ncbi:SMP-30/gluconolactonase/LRE family protein [Flavobacteriaceae bacterium]|nr:SMP-30/gluconolactonase/LRE family protein [Flavobacteriaceae bacterium]